MSSDDHIFLIFKKRALKRITFLKEILLTRYLKNEVISAFSLTPLLLSALFIGEILSWILD